MNIKIQRNKLTIFTLFMTQDILLFKISSYYWKVIKIIYVTWIIMELMGNQMIFEETDMLFIKSTDFSITFYRIRKQFTNLEKVCVYTVAEVSLLQ